MTERVQIGWVLFTPATGKQARRGGYYSRGTSAKVYVHRKVAEGLARPGEIVLPAFVDTPTT